VAEHWSSLKKQQNTYPRFTFTPITSKNCLNKIVRCERVERIFFIIQNGPMFSHIIHKVSLSIDVAKHGVYLEKLLPPF